MKFPNPRHATEEGLVAIGGNLKVATLKQAYEMGIFPWPQEGLPLLWFSPDPRGVLDFKEFKVPTSLKKFLKKRKDWVFTQNQAFPLVLAECRQQSRPGQSGTWITDEMEKAYLDFYKAGCVQSFECWDKGELIGGLYGVEISIQEQITKKNNSKKITTDSVLLKPPEAGKKIFSAESMFFKKSNASKLCLWKMVEYYQSLGLDWIDIQMVTPVTKSFGGKYISREEYLQRIGV